MDSNNKKHGAINERIRKNVADIPLLGTPRQDTSPVYSTASSNFDPLHVRSHLYHAIEGLDRYPNYLSRWTSNVDDMIRLEETLLEYARKVRQQLEENRALRQTIVNPLINEMISNENMRSDSNRSNEMTTTKIPTNNETDKLDDESIMFKKLQNPPSTWEEVKETILHPSLSKIIFRSKTFKTKMKPFVSDILSGRIDVELDIGAISTIMDEEMTNVYRLPLLQTNFCKQIQSYVTAFQEKRKAMLESDPTNTNPIPRLVDMDIVGLGWINNLLFHLILRPLSKHLFVSSEQQPQTIDLDWRQGYIASYSSPNPSSSTSNSNKLSNLVTHTDDSEITMNICLSEQNDFGGGQVEFLNVRGSNKQGIALGLYQPTIGTGIIHEGRHLHRVTDVTFGTRDVYIVWARSWKYCRSQLCPCCWLNNRPNQSCICGPKWN